MKKIFTLFIGICSFAALQAQSTVVGTTTYDLQTNGGNKSRLLVHDDGTVSAMWTGSTSGTISFTDRGMFFNSSPDGTTWGAFPTTRIEATRSGFGDMVKVGDHEVMLSHDGTNIYVYKNDELGGTSWTPTAGSLQITGLWPNAYCPEGTDDIYVVNANSGTPTAVYFSKSTDGGESWDILEYTLPYLTTDEGFGAIGGEAYQIAVHGSDVYVLYGANYADLVLLHSDAGGAAGTWTSEIIWDNPLENYTAAAGQTTDYDEDGDYDTILTTDGNYDLVMTDDGTLHVFAGTMYILDNNIAAGYSYFPTIGGILYWKTGLTGMYYLDVVIDWKNDDGLDDPYAGIGQSFASYGGESFTTLPSGAYDPATGRIYLTYTMPVEYTDQLGDPTAAAAESKNDLFGIYSDDNGESWTLPVNLTYTAFAGQENYFPMVYDRVVDGKIHVLWQQDDNPGTAVDAAPADAIHTNNLRYAVWDETRFQPYAPTVNFTYTLTPAGPSFDAAFTNISADAETYFWDFGDGFTSTLMNPTHTFAEGVYEVCLTGYNVYGEATACETIIAVFPPTALFDYTGDPTVDFTDLSTNEPTSWAWDFDDGGTSALQNPTHTYALNGIYNVCLTASNVGGASTYCENVVISTYAAPLANFSFTGDPTVSFTDLTIGDPTSWDWTFGDGDVSTEQNPVHTYATNGIYNVCLTATNALGTSTSCQDVTIGSYLPPVALFTFSGDPLVTFTDLSTESPSLWSWDFGDGEFSTEQNPVHNYIENGTYTVCLTATNDVGSGSSCQTVVIDFYPLPEAIFTFTGDPTVTFTDLSTNSPDSWFWNFDDGGFSSEQNPVHTFTTNDTYNVCLEVTNAGGVDVVCQDVVIGNVVTIPVADFDYFFGVDLSVSFFDNSTNSPASWAWTFGDGETSDLQDPVHVYAAPGSYNVCLTAGNAGGSDEYCQQITLTGIETNNAINLAAYPNPASAIIIIEMPQANNDVAVQVINAIGQKIAVEPIMNSNNANISLNIESLPAGAYTVVINAASIKYIATFIKE